MGEVIFENILVIILSFVVIILGNGGYINVIIAGLLMVYITYNYITEENNKIADVGALTIAGLFAVLGGHPLGYLIFYVIKNIKSYIRIIIAVFLYGMVSLYVVLSINGHDDKLKDIAITLLGIIVLVLIYALIFLVISLIRDLETKKEESIKRMQETNIREMHEMQNNEKLLRQNAYIEKNARLVERENISRNIHNNVGHSITAAVMTLEAADMLYEKRPDEARKKMNDANERIKGSLESIRRAIRVMDENSKDIISDDLKAEMSSVIDDFVMDTMIDVYKDFEEFADGINIYNEHALFMIGVLQELLTNGVKHGHADRFFVNLSGDKAYIKLEVTDNGHSDFNEENSGLKIANGYGIKKIISYVEKYGGNTSFAYDNGFKAEVELYI